MPITIKYPKNPNVDTAFVEQDDGTKNRALMIAPQDISTLELPNNPNSTKGYITVDGQKQRVILTADITGGGGGGSSLPDQTGHSGEFLTTDGTDASWAAVDALPSQTGQSGKFLTTDGTDASWAAINTLQNTATGTNGLGILGTSSSASSVVLGDGATDGSASRYYSVVIGKDAMSRGEEAIAIGEKANWQSISSASYSIALGVNTRAYGNAIAIGRAANALNEYSVAIGYTAVASANQAVQLGSGTNNTANTLKVLSYEMMSADGTIPTARLTKVNTTVTLTSAGWSGGSQTVTVTGMTATGVVLVSPDPTDQSAYTSAGIICTAQAADSLTFTCSTTPTADIDVNVVML